ncbi:MAG: DUF366 family protein [Actinomycetota bacterium]|nr:DUF366 family protein [Actinomycetota bacterium]MDD5667019.1 DUF366 family protein [Actinomycetota bacterium]
MKGKYIKGKKITYDGTQLRSLYAYTEHDVQGDSVLAFRGPCRVGVDDLVDAEDRKNGAEIISEEMAHFIVEIFDTDLHRAVVMQRIFLCVVKDAIEELKPELFISRRGDDLYIEVEAEEGEEENRKLTVSVATVSPVSALIHTGINVSSENTPVPTLGLEDLDVPVDDFIIKVLQGFINEVKGIEQARCKVRGVP